MSAQAAVALAPDSTPQLEPAFVPYEGKGLALVVDDNPDIANMLAAVLQHSGYDATAAYSSSDALTTALAKHFDVIVSDIGMPGMDGYEFARVLRAMPEYRAIPMVAVTGFAMYDDRERALAAGFDTHLSKPIDPLALKQALLGVWH